MAHFDLNLITTFVTLYETQSLTVTAERLFVTQPSISYSLAKLREQFDDVLFVRSSQGMRPTRLAAQLYIGFKQAVRCIDASVGEATVRRQNIWHNSRRKLAECGPRPGCPSSEHLAQMAA